MESSWAAAKQCHGVLRRAVSDSLLDPFQDALQRSYRGSGRALRRGLGFKGMLQFLLDRRIERHNFQFLVFREQRLNQCPAEPLAHSLHQSDRGLIHRGGIEQDFENRAQIADRHVLAQQLLQHFLNFSQRKHARYKFLHEFGLAFRKRIE